MFRCATLLTLLLSGTVPVRAAAPPPELVLDCYVTQSSDMRLGQFVRHLQVRPDRAIVVIADSLRGAAPRYVGTARLIALDPDHIVYDFAAANSGGRTEIDRRTGAFSYADGRVVVRGTCQQSEL